MLACYYSQGKQLASGVIGLLTCPSHYNVSGINTNPRARLLLRHSLTQRIPTRTCECCLRSDTEIRGMRRFFPAFPKPKTQEERCRWWIKQCGRPHSHLNISKNTHMSAPK